MNVIDSPSTGGRHITAGVTVACLLISVFAVVIGYYAGGRFYYLASVLIIVCAIVPFLVSFEGSKPQAADIAILAVLCAFAVASRMAFFWLPQFKPMAGIVMIAGVALGARAGLLVGSLSAFVSNFFFGQGFWTPFQMFAFGFAGLVFGLIGKTRAFSRQGMKMGTLVVLSLIAFAYVVLVLGPTLDTSSVLVLLSEYSVEGVLAVYMAGVPMNVVHGLATAITVLLLQKPITNRIVRVQKKFGL